MRLARLILAAILLPACAGSHDSGITPVQTPGTVTISAQLLNVEHDGHLYVVALFGEHGGAILHSPNCPAEKFQH
jgi:hypothetical protein